MSTHACLVGLYRHLSGGVDDVNCHCCPVKVIIVLLVYISVSGDILKYVLFCKKLFPKYKNIMTSTTVSCLVN